MLICLDFQHTASYCENILQILLSMPETRVSSSSLELIRSLSSGSLS